LIQEEQGRWFTAPPPGCQKLYTFPCNGPEGPVRLVY
jgi:hypothetical protein